MEYQFKVFKSSSIIDVGHVWIVITGTKFNTPRIETEWYYLSGNKSLDFHKSLRISTEYYPTIDEFWKKETLPNVANAIYYDVLVKRINDLSTKVPDYSLFHQYKEIIISEVAHENLIKINNQNKGFVDNILCTSNCEEIKTYIKKIQGIVITYEDIG